MKRNLKGQRAFKMETNSNLPVKYRVKYPVDLPSEDYRELNTNSVEHLSSLGTKSIRFPDGAKVKITHDSVGHLMLFGEDDPPHSVLALHVPGDETQVVALYLHEKWWPISDVLKTSSTHRNGLVFVESVMERIILFILSQIVFGVWERPLGEHVYFSAHPVREHGKLLWQDGEAVGFYTIKKKGSLCSSCSGQSYLLPVLDTVFVRTHWRRNGLALLMLQDFCTSAPAERVLGISYPISPSMYAVCKKYLEAHQEQRERLYEVEAPGEWSQRRNVWLNIQLQSRPTHSASSGESLHNTLDTDTERKVLKSSSESVLEKSRRPQRSCTEKRLINQIVSNKCKKAKTSL